MPQYPNLVIDADLSISGVGQLSNARIQNVTSAGRLTLQQELITSEAAGNTHTGQIIFDVDIQTLFIFVSANSQFEPVSFNQQGDVMFKGVINPTNANTNTTAGAESGSGSAGTDSDSGVDSGSTGSTTTTTTANWVVVGAWGDDDNGTNSGSVYVYDANDLSAQPTKLTAFDGAANDWLGISVAATNDKIIVGANLDDDNGESSGSVYVYDVNDLSAQPTKLTAFDAAEGDYFGWSVAATSDKIIVGAYYDEDNGFRSGSVYVFDANNLSAQPTKLTAFDGDADDRFGISVAATADKIVVSAVFDDDNFSNSGSVYVYDANDLSATPTKLTAFDGAESDRFSSSIVATADKIIVAARGDDDNGSNSGSVYVFDANDLSAQPTKLTAFDGAEYDQFGISVAATNDKIIVGANLDDDNGEKTGSVYIYDANDLTAQPTKLTAFDAAAGDYFGSSVAATDDKIIVGASGDDDNGSSSGSAYVFDANDLSATPTKLTAFDGAANLGFATSLAIAFTTTTTTSSGSGDTGSTGSTTTTTTAKWAVVAAQGDDSYTGSVYVYDANDLTAQPTKLTAFDGGEYDYFGKSVAATADKIIVGANYDDDKGDTSGSVYVYDANDLSAQPTKLTAFDGAASDQFGWSVAATADKIVVGTWLDDDNGSSSGSVYVYDANNLSAQPTKLTAFDGAEGDRFGSSVATTDDKIVVGVYGDDDDGSMSGSVYVYDANDLSATPTKLTAFDGAENDRFGQSVATTVDKIIVSAFLDDDNGNASGSVYVYDTTDLSATPTKLTAFDGAAGDQFGSSIDVIDDKIVVGAPTDDDGGSSSGSVYVFDANDLTAQPTKLTAFDGAENDRFGSSVAASGDKIIVAADGDDDNGENSGSVYVYDANDLSATPTKLTAFDGAESDMFGGSVAIGSTTTTTTSSGSGAGTDSTSAGIDSSTVDTSGGGVLAFSGFQYVVDTAGTLVRDGVTFYPNGQVEVGDIVLFTSETEAYVLQSNVSPATTTKAGTINLATQAAVDAGVIDSDAVTPATLAGSQLAAQVVLNTSAQNTNATDIASLQAFTGEGTALSSTATDLAAAINELVGRADSSATEIDGLEALVGEGTVLATAATSLSAGLNELVARQDSSDSELDAIFSDLNSLQAFTGQGTALDTTAADLAAAINELHGEIVTNASEVAANTSDIAPTTAFILTNTSEIVANDSDLAALNTRLGEIDVDLSGVNDTITSLYTQIASNDADIATIVSTFGSNDTELANLAARMLTAEGNIDANDSDILALQTRMTPFEGNTTANDSDISANAALISSLETYFGSDSLNTSAITLAGAINELHSDADANAAAILGNDSDILGLQTLLGYGSLDTTATTLAGAINELQSEITANDSDIAVLTGLVSTVESSDDIKAFNQENITFVADVEQTITHNLGLEIVTGFTIAVMDGTGDMIEATIRALDSNSIGIMTEFDVSNASMFMLANLSAPAAGDIPPGTVMTQSGGYVVTQGGVYVVLNGYTGDGTSTESGSDSSSPAPAPAPSNQAPTISGVASAYTLTQGQDTVITASATDPEGDAITWSYEVISGDLAGTTVAQSGNVFTVSHGLQDTNFTLRFKATDSAGNVTSHDATFAFSYTNQAPTISGVASAYTLTQGQDTVITGVATDPEGDAITWSYEEILSSGSTKTAISPYNTGEVYVYDSSDLTGTPIILSAPDGNDTYFGSGLHSDSDNLYVTTVADSSPRFYVYDLNDLSATPTLVIPPTGAGAGGNALGHNKNMFRSVGDKIYVSNTETRMGDWSTTASGRTKGVVFVYDKNDWSAAPTILSSLDQPNGTYHPTYTYNYGSGFGKAIEIYDSNLYVTRASGSQNVWDIGIFVYDINDLSSPPAFFDLTSATDLPDNFGVNLIATANNIVISASNTDVVDGSDKSGAFFVYDRSNLNATPTKITAPTPIDGDRFAHVMTATDSYIIASRWDHHTHATNSRNSLVELYDINTFNHITTISPPAGSIDSSNMLYFGNTFAVSGSKLLIAATGDESGGVIAVGSVFVYDINDLTASPTQQILPPSSIQSTSYAQFGSDITITGALLTSGLAGTTVSQSDNVFTVTPGSESTSFSMRFTATDSAGNATSVTSDITFAAPAPTPPPPPIFNVSSTDDWYMFGSATVAASGNGFTFERGNFVNGNVAEVTITGLTVGQEYELSVTGSGANTSWNSEVAILGVVQMGTTFFDPSQALTPVTKTETWTQSSDDGDSIKIRVRIGYNENWTGNPAGIWTFTDIAINEI